MLRSKCSVGGMEFGDLEKDKLYMLANFKAVLGDVKWMGVVERRDPENDESDVFDVEASRVAAESVCEISNALAFVLLRNKSYKRLGRSLRKALKGVRDRNAVKWNRDKTTVNFEREFSWTESPDGSHFLIVVWKSFTPDCVVYSNILETLCLLGEMDLYKVSIPE